MSARGQGGASLVEIMIALVLGLVLSAGVIQIYIANKQAYRASDATSRIQENARFAMDALTASTRMAGYQGCGGEARTIVNTLDTDDAGYSAFLYDLSVPLSGFEATSASTWSPSLDTSLSGSSPSPVGGSDVVTIRGILGGGSWTITGQPSNSGDCSNASSHTANLKLDSGTGLADGDIVIATNCSNLAIFQITNVNDSGTVVHNTGNSTTPGNDTKNLGVCFAGNGELARITTRSFYIGDNGAGGRSLYRKDGSANPVELVEGVENMQILYGEDTSADGSANTYVPANTVGDWSRVVSVRISLLLRSAEDNVVSDFQTYTFNGGSVTAVDRRLRRVYTTTIGLRNRIP